VSISTERCRAFSGSFRITGKDTLVMSYFTNLAKIDQMGIVCPSGRIYGKHCLFESVNMEDPPYPF